MLLEKLRKRIEALPCHTSGRVSKQEVLALIDELEIEEEEVKAQIGEVDRRVEQALAELRRRSKERAAGAPQ